MTETEASKIGRGYIIRMNTVHAKSGDTDTCNICINPVLCRDYEVDEEEKRKSEDTKYPL
jgi:hypothetical protein